METKYNQPLQRMLCNAELNYYFYKGESMHYLGGYDAWLKKMRNKFKKKNNKKLKLDAQGAGCPHCGHYCTGKSAFCNPPIKSAT